MRVWIAPRETESDGPRPNCFGFVGTFCWKGELEEAADAEKCFTQALEIARRQQAKSYELRAATGLAQLWRQQGREAESRALLVEATAAWPEALQTPTCLPRGDCATSSRGRTRRTVPSRHRDAHGVEQFARAPLGGEMAKTIILFSDGTGNSAAKLAKTNVWRTYRRSTSRSRTRSPCTTIASARRHSSCSRCSVAPSAGG